MSICNGNVIEYHQKKSEVLIIAKEPRVHLIRTILLTGLFFMLVVSGLDMQELNTQSFQFVCRIYSIITL